VIPITLKQSEHKTTHNVSPATARSKSRWSGGGSPGARSRSRLVRADRREALAVSSAGLGYAVVGERCSRTRRWPSSALRGTQVPFPNFGTWPKVQLAVRGRGLFDGRR
jgi:hypothetical protein